MKQKVEGQNESTKQDEMIRMLRIMNERLQITKWTTNLEKNLKKFHKTSGTLCKCLPSCSSIHYDADVSDTKMDMISHYKATNQYAKEDEE